MLSDAVGMNRSNRVGMSIWDLDPSLQGDELLAVSRVLDQPKSPAPVASCWDDIGWWHT